MDWTAVGTILATGVVTLGSVWLKGRYDQNVERAKILSDREAANDARDRQERAEREVREYAERAESVAHDREEKKHREAQGRAELTALRQNGQEVVSVVATLLNGLSALDDRTNPAEMETIWNRDCDAKVREASELISATAIRESIILVADQLADFEMYAEVNSLEGLGGWHAKVLVRTILELAGCVSRGEQPSPRLVGILDEVRTRIAAVEEKIAQAQE